MRLVLHHFDLPLRHRFTISRGSIDVQPTVIVEIQHAGQQGFGEATTNSYYSVSRQSLTAAVERARPIVEQWSGDDPTSLWNALQGPLTNEPFAQCAIDCAAHDLWGKLKRLPVYHLWGETLDQLPRSNYTVAIDNVETMVAKLREFPDWPIYKIKLGTSHDLEIIRELRKHTAVAFRVDANCGWTAVETLQNAHDLAPLGVEFIEQPLPRECDSDMPRLLRESPLPIIADESCTVPSDVERCHGLFHGVNIKLVKCGGLTPARRMIVRARELGLKVMIGCMTESSIGISAAAQLLPQVDFADLDGAVLLARDIAQGVQIIRGTAVFPQANGCGVRRLAAPQSDVQT